jgi:hypothetical protein
MTKEREVMSEAKLKERMEANLKDPSFIALKKRIEENKQRKREGYRPIKTAEIEELFLKWVKVDYSRKKYVKITTVMEHIIERETNASKNDVEYLKKIGNEIAFSSILAKLCIKYKASCRKFNDGKFRIDSEGDKMPISSKRYALTLI